MTANATTKTHTKRAAGMTVRDALRDGIVQLLAAKTPSHALAAELLLMHATGRDRAWIYAHAEASMEEDAARRFFELVARRAAGAPTQYLTGKQEFWGLEFQVTPAVLIPRAETEHVIEVALERLRPHAGGSPWRVADVGTGSGCIAVALAKELPSAEIVATDISAAALEVARRNAERHGVSHRVFFVECDLLQGVAREAARFDVIVSNPPYVAREEESELAREVREHEPREALFGGTTGIEIYARLIEQAAVNLRAGGLLVLEIGHGAAERVRSNFDANLWAGIQLTNDLAGIPRVISAVRK
ncbi:MAG TPA: peptide chain release factor N(5)-glutamine methyltransferase [Candidatus Acidoferrales bacterium]|nr:peptide chain release factor N(5)-glutamine methyltransferase [Candidatus Acidoferrales bacterium]